ncbi:MAG: carbohydrate ABC transporter permease [Rhodoglobus sp.]
MLPALAVYLFVVVWPSLQGATLSFTDWNGIQPTSEFVGLENFRRAFDDSRMWAALGNTIMLALVITLVQTTLGLLFALGANSLIKSKNVIRVIMFAPVVVTPVATGFLFKNIFGSTGALNTMLENLGLASWTQEWLGNSDLALWMVCVVIIWQYTGYAMVIFLANLQGVPGELLEAAAIDGAGPFRRFWSIIRPQLAPAFAINIMLAIIGSLKQFDQVWVMTAGGPNGATETMSTLLYRVAFQYGQRSYGITIAVILTVVVLGFAILQNRAVAWQTKESK